MVKVSIPLLLRRAPRPIPPNPAPTIAILGVPDPAQSWWRSFGLAPASASLTDSDPRYLGPYYRTLRHLHILSGSERCCNVQTPTQYERCRRDPRTRPCLVRTRPRP